MMHSDGQILSLLSRPIVYRLPKRLLAPPSWTMHAPFAMWLIDILKPRTFVELGTFSGTSYCAFCEAVKELKSNTRCFAVDTWLGDTQSFFYGEEILSDLKQHHDPLYSDFSELIRKDFDSALPNFADQSIDLLHIDGFHTYEAVKHDFETWLPKVSERGVVIFHDTQVRERDFGVWRFWDEVRGKYPNAELLHGHGLGILLVGSDVPTEMQKVISIINNSNSEMETFQGFFEHLGTTCLLNVKLQSASEQISSCNTQIAELSCQIQNHKQEILQTNTAWELRGAEITKLTKAELALQAEVDKYEAAIRNSFIIMGDRSKGLTNKLQAATLKMLKFPSIRGTFRALLATLRGTRTLYSKTRIAFVVKTRRQLILESGLFDQEYYLEQNPSAVPTGTDPLDHFILHGGYAGLKCSALFDSGYYLDRYPDIRAAGHHPLIHYIQSGKLEGHYTTQHFAPDLFLSLPTISQAAKNTIQDLPRDRVAVASLFIVYGKAHLNFINSVLIPALKNQKGARPIEVNLVNYANNTPLFKSEKLSSTLDIRDWSAARDDTHIGFGEGHNFLFEKAKPKDCFIIVNPDSCPYPGCLDELYDVFEKTSAGIVEARQWPRSHPKEFDIETGNTPWASGAFSLIDSETFSSIKGFDPVFFLYGEDVDLSWRMWLAGKRVVIASKAICGHFTGLFSYRNDRFYYEHFYSTRNFIVLARKFFGQAGEQYALRLVNNCGFPDDFKSEILDSYQGMKDKIQDLSNARHSMIKILGMNIYHDFQAPKTLEIDTTTEVETTQETIAHAG
jgi:hypothetical protein